MREEKKDNIIEHNNALNINTKLEQYIVKGVLGAGGFGITYLADDTNLDKQVVIKEFLPEEIAIRKDNTSILPKTSRDEDSFVYGIEKFQEEAKTLAKFNHPNIVRILNFFKANGTAYLVMDYEEGEDLQEYMLFLGRSLTQKEILDIIIPILDGLREVHRHNFLHRDIKLSNIFIRKNSSPMLIDFGAARNAIGQKSKSITQILTPGYAPLEQYSTDISKQGAFTDIYATGAVMYKMATGDIPKEAQDRSNALIDGDADPYVSIKEKTKIAIDESFAYSVNWALKIRAKDRPQSVRELQKALEGIHDDEKEIQPLIPTTIKIKEKEPLKTRKEDREKKSNFLRMIGSIVVAIAVTITSVNYYNDAQDRDEKKIVKDKKEQEAKIALAIEREANLKAEEERLATEKAKAKAKRELGESIDRGSYIKPALVHIEGGSYSMGSDKGESDEKPVHQVTINYDFEIGKYEVSIAEYKKCVDDGGCKQSEWLEKGNSYNIDTGINDYYKKMCLKDNCPAIGVSWHNAKAYTKWLSQKTGKNYRLPTEAEWEFVAKAGTTTKWSFGDSERHLKNYAWYTKNSNGKPHQIGTKKANSWGVYDMHGNVWEWCEDWYLDSHNKTPKDGSMNQSQNKDSKVLRGGSWDFYALNSCSANRIRIIPTSRGNDIGFRLQRTLP